MNALVDALACFDIAREDVRILSVVVASCEEVSEPLAIEYEDEEAPKIVTAFAIRA